MNICLKIIGVLVGIMLIVNTSVLAQKGMGNSTGMARNYLQPDIETIEGTLDHIKTGPCEDATGYAYIGTHLFLNTGNNDELINVHLGAAYAVESFVNGLETGQNVTVLAFRTEEMEPDEFVAKEVTANGHTLQLRDENLRPFWAGGRNFPRGRPFGHHGCRW